MAANDPTMTELLGTIVVEAEAAAESACRFLDFIGATGTPMPLGFMLGLGGRVRYVEWEARGWGHLVPPEHRPAERELVRFVEDALAGNPVEPAWASPTAVFRTYFSAVVHQTAWAAGHELRAPVAINRTRRLSPVELAELADFLWKHRHTGRN